MKLIKSILINAIFWGIFTMIGYTFIEDFNYTSYSLMGLLSFIFGVMCMAHKENPNESN